MGDGDPTGSLITELEEIIWQRRPILGEIMKKHGDKTLYSYTQDFLDINKSPRLDARKPELIAVVERLLAARLGPEVAAGVATQLRELPLVSTADHHGPVTHPFFLNSNIITGLPLLEKSHPNWRYLIDFSFATVSMNNSSYPRGVVLHPDAADSNTLLRVPLSPDKSKMATVYTAPAYSQENLDRACAELEKKIARKEIPADKGQKVIEILKTYFGAADVINDPDICSQITKINFRLWQHFFKQTDGLMPDVIYIEIETIVTELLQTIHFKDTASLIHQFLFDTESRRLFRELFNNIPGAFSIENNWGTFLFWAIDKNMRRVQLFLKGDELRSDDGTQVYPLTPDAISKGLATKEIFPSMTLCYIIISLYYGMKCLGGFSQVNDLTRSKTAWQEWLRRVGNLDEAEAVEPVQTKELGGDGMMLACLPHTGPEVVPATGIDLMLEPRLGVADFLRLSKQLTLNEMMLPMLPEIYTVLYSQPDRDPKFADLTPGKIIEAIGLNKKI